jgi:hypothetical protein
LALPQHRSVETCKLQLKERLSRSQALAQRIVRIERTTTSDYVKTAAVTDPAGNRVVFAEHTAHL